MRNVQQSDESLQGPLTAAIYADMCAEREWHGRPIPLHVQFRKRGVVECARIVEVKQGANDVDWFRLDAGSGPLWASHFNVRACASNGVCHCEASAVGGEVRDGSGACAVPLGNTGTTNEAGA